MPLSRLDEPLHGGYVNTRGASSLGEGELSDGLNVAYDPDNLSLGIANATAAVGNAAGSGSVLGLTEIAFPGVTRFQFYQRGASYYYFNGSVFTTVGAAITGGTDVDYACYDSRYFVFNGVDSNRVLYMNGATKSMRSHGVTAVTQPCAAALVAGNWVGELGTYEYWHTEVVVITEGSSTYEIESDFTGSPSLVTVTATTDAVLVGLPTTLVNASATKWRVYRGGPRVSDGVAVFPVGLLVAELATTIPSFTDGAVTDSGYKRPATAATTGGSWATTTGITAGTQGDNTPTTYATNSSSTLTAYGYSFTAADPIAGIAVFVRAKITGAVVYTVHPITIAISGDSGVTYSDERGVPIGVSNAYLGAAGSELCVVGGNTDLWGELPGFWSAAMLNGANTFRVRVTIPPLTQLQMGTISIDDIDVRAYYGGSVNDPAGVFPYYSLSVDGAASAGSMLGAPPISSTGAIFEDSLVVNDIAEPTIIRYSPAGQPEYFPGLYYMRLDLGRSEVVTSIKAVGSRLVVATQYSLYRVNFLPRVTDASFDRGRPIEMLSSDIGIERPSLSCLYTNPVTGRPAMFFVGNDGRAYSTDGYEVRPICPDVVFSPSQLRFVVNQPRETALGIFYGSVVATRRIELQYNPQHLKRGGQFKASAPIELGENISSGASLASGGVRLGPHSTAADGSKLYGTDFGHGAASFGTTPYVTTRRFWPAGVGNEVRINGVHLLDDGATLNGTYSMQPLVAYTNTPEATATAVDKTFSGFSSYDIGFDFNLCVEGVRLKQTFTGSTGIAMWNHLMVEFENLGEEHSRA